MATSSGSERKLGGKGAAWVALATFEPNLSRERIAAILWPDSPATQARNNLRTLSHRLGKHFGGQIVVPATEPTNSAVLQLLSFPIRAEEILAAMDRGGPNRCDLLDGVELENLPEFEAWLGATRQRLRRLQLAELEQVMDRCLAAGDSAHAVDIARACVQLEPLSEHWHRRLMSALNAHGDRAAALVAYEGCKAMLRDNAGGTPDERTRRLHVQILQTGNEASSVGDFPGATAAELVEREVALQGLEIAFANGMHLTIEGEPGVGKTALWRRFIRGRAVEVVAIRNGAEHERYAALEQVLQQVQQSRALRPQQRDLIELARIAPLAFPQFANAPSGVSFSRLREALSRWSVLLQNAGVGLLVIDDLHHADPASQEAIATLIGPTHRLQCLFGFRSGEVDAVLEDAIARAHATNRLARVIPDRLSEAGIATLLHLTGLDAAAAQAWAPELLRRTGGNPLFVTELARFNPRSADAPSTGDFGLSPLLQSRLAGCSPAARELAHVANVAGGDFSVEVGAALLGTAPADLMPMWSELQGRGLFTADGLAHDLIREAIDAVIPAAIRQALHRQVARHLESQGRAGASVLRHLLAAKDFEGALPHAVYQKQLLALTGRQDGRHHETLFSILENVNDACLCRHLWITSHMGLWVTSRETLPRLRRLVDRVAVSARSVESRAWIAHERARLLVYDSGDRREAYRLITEALQLRPLSDVAICYLSILGAVCANQIGESPVAHVHRAIEATSRMPPGAERLSFERDCFSLRILFVADHAALAREARSLLHARRRVSDVGGVQDAHIRLGYTFRVAGVHQASARHFRLAAAGLGEAEMSTWRTAYGDVFGRAALQSGRFSEAIECLEQLLATGSLQSSALHVVLAGAWLDLGRFDLACERADRAPPISLGSSFSVLVTDAMTRSKLALRRGLDPAQPLADTLHLMHQAGGAPIYAGLLELALAQWTQPPAVQVQIASRMHMLVQSPHPFSEDLTTVHLMRAEALARADDPGARVPALAAAEQALRGRTGGRHYPPEVMVRLARVLEPSDPGAARRLTAAAQRWVVAASKHLPPSAAETFLHRHPINTALLTGAEPELPLPIRLAEERWSDIA